MISVCNKCNKIKDNIVIGIQKRLDLLQFCSGEYEGSYADIKYFNDALVLAKNRAKMNYDKLKMNLALLDASRLEVNNARQDLRSKLNNYIPNHNISN